jgi:hypothetical protein
MRSTITKLFCGIDNKTPDLLRVLVFIGAIFMVIYSGVSVYKLGTFDPLSFGTGFGGLLAGGGAGVGFKRLTEPQDVSGDI